MKRLVKKAKTLKLYHGTTNKFLDNIKEKGILCTVDAPQMATGPASGGYLGVTDPYNVFLTNQEHIAKYYANRAVQAFGGEPIVIEVSVNSDNLIVDEDFTNNAVWNSETKKYELTIPTTGDFVELTEEEYDNFTGEDCLKLMGTVAYRGNIPASNIINIIE